MRAKKRLQTLVSIMVMLSMICGSLPAAYADDPPAEEMPSYKASDYYDPAVASNPHAINGEAPWEWDYYDMGAQKYFPMKRTNISQDSGCFAAFDGYNDPKKNGYTSMTAMDGTTMHGDARNGNDVNGAGESAWVKTEKYAGAWQQYYPVRSFTAPKTGNITITEDSGKIEYTGSATMQKFGVNFRILLERGGQTTQVWPESGYGYAWKGNPVSFRALSLNIQKNDILRFEMYTPTAETNGSNYLHAKWNPVVSYNSYSFVTEYQASKAFVPAAANLGNYNPGDNWDWNCYVYGDQKFTWKNIDYPAETYTPMTIAPDTDAQKFGNTGLYPIPEGETVDKELYAIGGETVGIGKYWMRAFRIIDSSTGKQGYFGKVYSVRTFKAKEAGEVTISAVGRLGKNRIASSLYDKSSDEINQRGVRVVKESGGVKTQLWPTDENKGDVGTKTYNEATWALVPAKSAIDFPPLTTTLRAGDKLHFELANVSPEPEDDSKYGCAVYWDPKVSYTTGIVAKADEITFENAGGKLTEFSSVAGSATDVTVTIPTTACFVTPESVTPIAAVYNQEGRLVSYATGTSAPLAMNKREALTVSLPSIMESRPSDGYVKVFLWDSVAGLTPLSDIGANPVFGTAAGAEAVYAGTGQPGQNVALLIKGENDTILHIEQGTVDEAGRFRIPVPAGMEAGEITCTLPGELIDANRLYASNNGQVDGAGTTASPLSFQKALELAKYGDKIIVMDEIVLPADFAWPTADKHVTVSGEGYANAALNLYQLQYTTLYIHTDATLEHIEIAATQTGAANGTGKIAACGNVVTLAETMDTRGILDGFNGGGLSTGTYARTESYVYGGNYKTIYGGSGHVLGDCKLTVGGKTNTTAGSDPVDESNKDFAPIIYGGVWDNMVDGDCITTVTGAAAARYLYGGCLDYKDSAQASGVKGDTIVNVNGGRFMNVYGMNPPSSAEDSSNVVVNMTGGTVEALIGSSGNTPADVIKGSVTINALGGTVTRRIIGGVYNDLEATGRKHITGTVAVRIGGELQGFTYTWLGNGIITGSRIEAKPGDETAMLIFLDGTYDRFKNNITHMNGSATGADWCGSNYDYLVTGTAGGNIIPKAGNVVEIASETGYIALLGTSLIESGDYTLNQARTDVTFSRNAIYSLSAAATANGAVKAAVSYISESDANVMILALYDGDTLAAMVQADVSQGTHADTEVTIPCTAENGKSYTLKAFFWNNIQNIMPVCEAARAEITVR